MGCRIEMTSKTIITGMRVAVFMLLFMAHVTGTKSSVLRTHLRANTRELSPWQQLEDTYVRNSRLKNRMMSPCDGKQMGRCRQNPEDLRSINDRVAEFQEVKVAKRSPTTTQQSTGPPRGWWIYVNGHRRGKKMMLSAKDTADSTPPTTIPRTILDEFAEFLTLKNRGALDKCLGK